MLIHNSSSAAAQTPLKSATKIVIHSRKQPKTFKEPVLEDRRIFETRGRIEQIGSQACESLFAAAEAEKRFAIARENSNLTLHTSVGVSFAKTAEKRKE